MGEMKSAFEKALERAEKLGKLSPEEMREQKQTQYAPIGRALAERYLKHGYGQVLIEEVNRYSGDEKDIVIQTARSRLKDAIGLEDDELAEKAMSGLLILKGGGKVEDIIGRIRSLLGEYQEAQQQKFEQEREQIERRERELLHQLRISGGAIAGVNPKASQAWQEILSQLSSRYNERLEELKRELLNSSEED